MVDESLVVFIEKATTYRIEGGLVYAEDRSGAVTFRRVMSPHTLRVGIVRAQRTLDEWEKSRHEPVKLAGRKKRTGHAAS